MYNIFVLVATKIDGDCNQISVNEATLLQFHLLFQAYTIS